MTSSSLLSLSHGVFNDSSFAAVTTPDGTRHVFFQDVNGTIRQLQYSITSHTWLTSLSFVIPNTTDAKQSTPIAAIILEESNDISTPILLFYISQNSRIAATMFNYENSQSWENASTFFNISQYTTAPSSKSLSITQVPDTNSSSQLLLWFESRNGGVIGLLGSHANVLTPFRPTILDSFWSWADVSSALKAQIPVPDVEISAPFSVTRMLYTQAGFGNIHQDLCAIFFVPNQVPNASLVYSQYYNATWGARKCIEIPDSTSLIYG